MAKTIETRYSDVLFRSRTEARWAVFMDEAGLSWLYEPEGFQLKSGWYLPDFWLPDLRMYLEVKPPLCGREIARAIQRVNELHLESQFPVALICGSPCDPEHDVWLAVSSQIGDGEMCQELLSPRDVSWSHDQRSGRIVLHARPMHADRVFMNADGTLADALNGHVTLDESRLLYACLSSARCRRFWEPSTSKTESVFSLV